MPGSTNDSLKVVHVAKVIIIRIQIWIFAIWGLWQRYDTTWPGQTFFSISAEIFMLVFICSILSKWCSRFVGLWTGHSSLRSCSPLLWARSFSLSMVVVNWWWSCHIRCRAASVYITVASTCYSVVSVLYDCSHLDLIIAAVWIDQYSRVLGVGLSNSLLLLLSLQGWIQASSSRDFLSRITVHLSEAAGSVLCRHRLWTCSHLTSHTSRTIWVVL